ncbi:hypothetical protein B1R94_07520 [Mycolicibacterium litorale]|nr:hypothetical protein B1R94_07520 [Mycolicibacterium litorale]
MATLKVRVPATVDVTALQSEIVTALADRLRDDHGYSLVGNSADSGEYRLAPSGSIVVRSQGDVVTVKLRGVDADAGDLFTVVSGELEQRHDGVHIEID